jgi:hypothetical protein
MTEQQKIRVLLAALRKIRRTHKDQPWCDAYEMANKAIKRVSKAA